MTSIDDLGFEAGSEHVDLALQRLVTAQRVHALYPRRNPKVLTSVTKLREALAAFPAERPLELSVGREHLLYESLPVLADQPEVRELARKLYLASIGGLVLEAEASEDEVLELLDLLRLSDDERRELGSLSETLRRRGVNHIQVREVGQVSISVSASGEPWDLASLEELEALEMTVLQDGESASFHQSFSAVGEGQDPRAGRLLGLLARPAEFATLLLDTASQHRPGGLVDLDGQLGFVTELVARLGPMLQKIPPADAARLYGRLGEVVVILERSAYRELLDLPRPPYVRLARIRALFPAQVRPMTVKEALGLGLGPGLMPVLMSSLRRIADGDTEIVELINGAVPGRRDDAPYLPTPPIPPVAFRMTPSFFDPTPGGQRHPAERTLGEAIERADGQFDSIETLLDLLAEETDLASYGRLLELMAQRFRHAFTTRSWPFATRVLRGLQSERERRARIEGQSTSAQHEAVASLEQRLGAPETMRLFLEAVSGFEDPAELTQAVRPLTTLGAGAVNSLMSLLLEETDRQHRIKLLEILALVGRPHVELVLKRATEGEWFVARNVVYLLARWGPEQIPHVLPLARHPEPRVRKEVIRTLAQFRAPAAIEGIGTLVQSEDESVAREAIKTLVELREAGALNALHQALQSPHIGKRQPPTIAALVRALDVLGDSDTAKILRTVVETRAHEAWLATSPRLGKLFADVASSIDRREAGAPPAEPGRGPTP